MARKLRAMRQAAPTLAMRRLALPVPALLLALSAILAAPGCTAGVGERVSLSVTGERASLPAISGRAGFNPPAAGQLESLLQSELARLGKSASDTTPHAPTGVTNAVFDLTASVIDPDGPPDGEGGGTLPPTGITLAWTERLLGDYDENGQVNAADLAPLGMNWQRTVLYDNPALHGGIAYWPDGNPLDDGGSVYPAAPANGSGAQNWRRARVDGMEDGLLNAQDVMPIAAHWYEQSAGYRVYAKLPGETDFHVIPNPDDAGSPLTIPRAKAYPVGKSSPDATRPVRFNFSYGDGATALPDGQYELYVAAFDSATNTDGPASAHITLTISVGVANVLPVARVTASPDFAGAPAVVTLDASASTDADGSIAEYRWDFDADGVIDWSTADASVPDKSSGGEVDTITPATPPGAGMPPTGVSVTYHQGYAEYQHPQVTVVDDKGGTDTQTVQLGISGWVHEVLSSESDTFNPPGDEITASLYDIALDPNTGEICLSGMSTGFSSRWGTPWEEGLYLIRRHSDGTWDKEVACPGDAEILKPNVGIMSGDIVWQTSGQPAIVFFEDYISSSYRVLLTARQTDGSWQQAVIRETPTSIGVLPGQVVQSAPGEFYVQLEQFTGETDPHGLPAVHYYVAHCQDLNVEIWDTGRDTADGSYNLNAMSLDSTGQPLFPMPSIGETKHELWAKRRSEDGMWYDERLDSGLPVLDNLGTTAKSIVEREDGILGILVDRHFYEPDWRIQWCCAVGTPGALTLVPIRESGEHAYLDTIIRDTPFGFSVFTCDRYNYMPLYKGAHHELVDIHGNLLSELVYEIDGNISGSFVAQPDAVFDASGNCYALIYASGGEYIEDGGLGIDIGRIVELLCTRLDPRIP